MVLSGLKMHLNLLKMLQKTALKIVVEGYLLEADFQYPEKLDDLHIDLFF